MNEAAAGPRGPPAAPEAVRRGFPGWLRTLLFISLFFWLLWLRGVVFESYVVAWRALIVESDLDPGINKFYHPYHFSIRTSTSTGSGDAGEDSLQGGADKPNPELTSRGLRASPWERRRDNAGARFPSWLTVASDLLRDPLDSKGLSRRAFAAVMREVQTMPGFVPSLCSPVDCGAAQECPRERLAWTVAHQAWLSPTAVIDPPLLLWSTGAGAGHGTSSTRVLDPSSPLTPCWCALVVVPERAAPSSTPSTPDRLDVSDQSVEAEAGAGRPTAGRDAFRGKRLAEGATAALPPVPPALQARGLGDLAANIRDPNTAWAHSVPLPVRALAARRAPGMLATLSRGLPSLLAVAAASGDSVGSLLFSCFATHLTQLAVHVVRGVFFGSLSPFEVQSLAERLVLYIISRFTPLLSFFVCLPGATSQAWVVLWFVQYQLYSFLTLAKIRFDVLQSAPNRRPGRFLAPVLLLAIVGGTSATAAVLVGSKDALVAARGAAAHGLLRAFLHADPMLATATRLALSLLLIESVHTLVVHLHTLAASGTLARLPADAALMLAGSLLRVVSAPFALAWGAGRRVVRAITGKTRAPRPGAGARGAGEGEVAEETEDAPADGGAHGRAAAGAGLGAAPEEQPQPQPQPQPHAPRQEGFGDWHARGMFLFMWDVGCELALVLVQLLECMVQLSCHYRFAFSGIGSLPSWVLGAILMLQVLSLVNDGVRLQRSAAQYLSALRNLTQAFEDVRAEDLHPGEECAICKDDLLTAKKLPCGHRFHFSCLRLWLDQSATHQQFTCPICRQPLSLPMPGGVARGGGANGGAGGAPAADPDEAHLRQEFPAMFAVVEAVEAVLGVCYAMLRLLWWVVVRVAVAIALGILISVGVHVEVDRRDPNGEARNGPAAQERRAPARARQPSTESNDGPVDVVSERGGAVHVQSSTAFAEESQQAPAAPRRLYSWQRGMRLYGTAAQARELLAGTTRTHVPRDSRPGMGSAQAGPSRPRASSTDSEASVAGGSAETGSRGGPAGPGLRMAGEAGSLGLRGPSAGAGTWAGPSPAQSVASNVAVWREHSEPGLRRRAIGARGGPELSGVVEGPEDDADSGWTGSVVSPIKQARGTRS